MKYKVAVIGATGNVGREILEILETRKFPIKELFSLASKKSAGKKVRFGRGKVTTIQNLASFNFENVDLVLSSAGAKISKIFVPKATAKGSVVIDNTSYFRMDKDVPLVIPEVNPEAIINYKKRNIIANPNCSTIQMVLALKPLHEIAKIKRVVVSTYQSTSGAGKKIMDELSSETKLLNQNTSMRRKFLTKPIAFNVIPHIDIFMKNGSTKEEWKMEVETKKILDPSIKISATCVRVPVFVGHAESLNIEFKKNISENKARKILNEFPGISVIDRRSDGGYITPKESHGTDLVYVSRIRKDATLKNTLSLWIVADNLRKGAALNTVQIAEKLISSYLRR
jgi:aspartate-semialdehyde dehydrogenase